MIVRKLCFGLLAAASTWTLLAQTDSNGLTITASRSMAMQPDQEALRVIVISSLGTGLDDVLAAIATSGIASADLTTVYTTYTQNGNGPNAAEQALEWIFTIQTPITTLKNTIAALELLKQVIGKKNAGWRVDYSGWGTQVSSRLRDSQQCSLSDLIADARLQAQKMANATGATVGPILAVSDGSSASPAFGTSGLFLVADVRLGTANFITQRPPLTCSVVVKFSLLPSQ